MNTYKLDDAGRKVVNGEYQPSPIGTCDAFDVSGSVWPGYRFGMMGGDEIPAI